MSASTIQKWRVAARHGGEPFPPPGSPLPVGWTWLCARRGEPAAHYAAHNTAPVEVRRKQSGWGATVQGKALRQLGATYYADGATGFVTAFATAYEAATVAFAHWDGATRKHRDSAANHVRMKSYPGLRWEQSEVDAGPDHVWLRPAFIAVRVPKKDVEPWQ